MPPDPDLLHLLREVRYRLDGDVSLEALASRAGWSKFHLHRAFRRLVGETPKQYTLRLRLEGAAAALAGHPITRYLSAGPGLYEIEVCIPLAAPAAGQGDVLAGVLPAGPVAVAVHAGPYDQLPETYAALERWIESNGLRTGGAPWEREGVTPWAGLLPAG